MKNLTVIEAENEVLRAKYKELKQAAGDLVTKVELYVRQECLRSDLLNSKERLKALLEKNSLQFRTLRYL